MNRTTLLAAPLAIAAFLPSSAPAQTADRTLSAIGTGEVELRPDRGTISIAVARRARAAEPARARTERRVAGIVRAVRAEGVPRASIATAGTVVRRVQRKSRPAGFIARTSLIVGVQGIARLGRVIDAATRRGATDVYGPDLSVAPERRAAARRGAEAAALADADARAAAAAAAEGQRIAGVQTIDLDPDQYASFDSGSGASADRLGSGQIFAGRQTFAATVRVTYLIEPVG